MNKDLFLHRFMASAGGLLLALGLAACAASAPVRHYTLQPTSVGAPPDGLPGFALQSVRVPAYVDSVPLVVRRGAAGLGWIEGHHWSSPLNLEWRGALSLAIRDAGGGPDLARAGVATADVPVLRVDLQQFDIQPGEGVSASGVWSLERSAAGDAPAHIQICRFDLQAATGTEPADWVAAHQQLIARLGGQIVAVMRQRAADTGAECPA